MRRTVLGVGLLAASGFLVSRPAEAATAVYYSIGTNAGDLKPGGGVSMTINSGTAIFSAPLADNIGVGDEITYNTTSKAYISVRSTSTVYTVITATGGVPANVSGATVDSIKRAFNTVNTANSGSADGNHLNTTDLVGGNFQLNWPCYDDGPLNDAASPNWGITITGWTTGASNDIRLYTPVSSLEVGVSQRHRGRAGTGFRLAPVVDNPRVMPGDTPGIPIIIRVETDFLRVEGIEIDGAGLTNVVAIRGIVSIGTLVGELGIDRCMIYNLHATNGEASGLIRAIDITGNGAPDLSARISNNFIYDLLNTTNQDNSHVTAIDVQSRTTSYVYNNTVFRVRNTGGDGVNNNTAGAAWGIRVNAVGATLRARNNYSGLVSSFSDVESCFHNNGGTLDQGYNVSSDATANCGATCQINQSSYASYFMNDADGSEDLHLRSRSSSSAVWNAPGTDLAADPNLPVTDDVDGHTRRAGQPDIGADEYRGTAVYYSVGTSPSNLRSSSGLTVTISSGSALFSEPQADNVGVGDRVTYNGGTVAYISGRSSSRRYSLTTGIGAMPPDIAGATVDTITRAFNSLTAANAGSTDATHLNLAGPPYDLVAASVQLNWPCYDDGPLDDRASVSNWTTGPDNYIRIYVPFAANEVGASQRHSGVAGTGFRIAPVIDAPTPVGYAVLEIAEEYVRVEGIEIDGSGLTNSPNFYGIYAREFLSTTSDVRIDGCIIHDLHDLTNAGFQVAIFVRGATGTGATARISNNIVYDITSPLYHVIGISVWSRTTSYVYNNTVYHIRQYSGVQNGAAWGIQALTSGGESVIVIARNNYVGDVIADSDPVFWCYDQRNPGAVLNQQSNVASDTTGNINSMAVYTDYFVDPTVGSEDLHLKGKSNALWGFFGLNLTADPDLPIVRDVDWHGRNPVEPDIGADQFLAVTAVGLMSFEAAGLDGAVELKWRTGSEVNNLGFHLYRSAGGGPYERITPSVIPGLGTSPAGGSYSYLDAGLTNGVVYRYKLEDIETMGATHEHGPVSAMPQAGLPGAEPEDEGAGSGAGTGTGSGGGSEGGGGTGSGTDSSGGSATRVVYGDPSRNALRVIREGSSAAVIELVTEGFYVVPQPEGTVRVEVPGFEESGAPGAPEIPSRRAWLETVAGRGVKLGSVRALEMSTYDLQVGATGIPAIEVGADGTVKAGRRRRGEGEAFRRAGLYPAEAARLVGVGFQGEVKKAELELSPLRWEGASRRVVLAKRLVVRVEFVGVEASERPLGGSRGRLAPVGAGESRGVVVAQVATRSAGVYRVRYEEVYGAGTRGRAVSGLRLSRLGEAVAFHVEPGGGVFGPGSVLYFVSEGSRLNPYGTEAVYELWEGGGGLTMGVRKAWAGGAGLGHYQAVGEWEENLTYQAGLLEAEDLWQWEAILSGSARSYPFTLSGVVSGGEVPWVSVWLQGGSDFESDPDHHVRIWINGEVVGEASWDGMRPRRVEGVLRSGLLREGTNQLTVENGGDTTASYSVSYLDKFSVGYTRVLVAEDGQLRGSFAESGVAEVLGLGPGAVAFDMSGRHPRWVRGVEATAAGVSFGVEAGGSYWAGEAISAEVRRPSHPGLKAASNAAEYLVLGPRALLAEAQPLVDRRSSQGLVTKAVAIEDVWEEFGHGESRPEAVREFLRHAYHRWSGPSLRYVVLLGDATYDFKDYQGTGQANQVPPLMVKTGYLWTASDPGYAAVNGEDALPDIAIGRLSARSVEEARALVAKVLAFEDGGFGFSGKAVLVADNADVAGEFEANSDAVAAMLGGREIEKIYLRDLGRAAMRPAIVDALNGGSALMSYVGHGAVAIWASENVFNIMDVGALSAQAQQPFLMTMNCLNGYIPMPGLNSLGEELVKAEGKGAVAAFAPSGLSVDGPAHLYQRALIAELTSGRHRRLGDAILAAQAAYADTGAFPELLSIYHLLGDPALELR